MIRDNVGLLDHDAPLNERTPMPSLVRGSRRCWRKEPALVGIGAGGSVAVAANVRRGKGVSVGVNLMCGSPSGRHGGAFTASQAV